MALFPSTVNAVVSCSEPPITAIAEAGTASGKNVIQVIKLKDGLDSDTAKKINKSIKESGIKAQSSIQGDKIRVTDKKRDTLQQVMNHLREQQFGVPLQFNNFKD